ncbi:hypothetical protein LTS15_009358 [Exophiala xenobiotica]|nr:hypothetical protein LTS15_009358 [Exophiala xenobiotica]
MKTEHKRKLIRLIEKERIHFHGPDHRQPGNHTQVFSALRELGRYTFDQYVHVFTYEAHQKPWRAKIKQQVERVVRLAEDCRYARQNELGWRLKLEFEILARFSTEVTWSDEPVKYLEDDPIFGALPLEQKPDRVFGFRKTSRFGRLLDKAVSDLRFEGKELRDVLECSPFNEMRDQVIFPFLVLEAKSETGDSFDDVEVQTAFAIKKLLDIQLKLQSATGERSQWRSGPLVWFLSNRGDDWRVAAAYVKMQGSRAHYHVHHMWTGSILSKDAALQLLLTMDYIFDWARDFQREAILNELRIVAGRNAASIRDDSEIRSLGDRLHRFLDADVEQRLMESRPDLGDCHPQHDAIYRWLDTKTYVFRSVCWAHARVSALYITKENLKTLLRSFTSENMSRRKARDLLRLLRDAWRVTPDALEALEFMWTGTQREELDLYRATQRYYAVFTVAAYFLPDWEQASELTYIAIAEDALDDLNTYVDMQQPIRVYPSDLPQVQQEHLVGYFRFFRQSSARSRLHAAMRRRCLSSRLVSENEFPNNFFLVAEERRIRCCLDATMLPDENPRRVNLLLLFITSARRV